MASQTLDLTHRFPEDFDVVLGRVVVFADPLLTGPITEGRWDPAQQARVR